MVLFLRQLLKTQDVEEFSARFLALGGADPARLPGLLKETALYCAAHLYPDSYSPPYYFVPHSYMGLIAAWQVRKYLEERDWWRPLLQAWWHVAHEVNSWGVLGRRAVRPRASRAEAQDLAQALTTALSQGDAASSLSLLAACQTSPEASRLASRILLSTALRDYTNIGHKYLYLFKVTALIRDEGWTEAALFYAPLHFLLAAPKDFTLYQQATTRLEPYGGRLSAGERRADYSEVIRLREAIVQNEDIAGLLLELLKEGCSLESLAQALLVVASHIVYYAPDLKSWWLYPVHGFNFTSSVLLGLSRLEPADRRVALLITGLYLREIARSTGNIKADESLTSVAPASGASLEKLEEAVTSQNVPDALSQVKGLAAQPAEFARLPEKLVLLSARKEQFLFSHVIKYAGFLLPGLKGSPWATEHLLALVKLLTLTDDGEVLRTAERVARGRAG